MLLLVVATLLATVLLAPAAAQEIGCGSQITQDTTLRHDIGPCENYGLIVTADDVTLDLNGYTIFGTEDVGDGAGIHVLDVIGVKVMNGTVRDFDGGVVIQGGGNHHVTGIVARDNIGQSEGHPPAPGTLYGDGIAVLGSSDNRIAHNVTVNNGPFAGIGLYARPDSDHPSFTAAPAARNAVMHNVVEDNRFCRVNRVTGARFCDNIGVRLEPGVGPDNAVMSNVIRGNGLDGLSLFADTDRNAVMRNLVENNGFWGQVPGDGIRVFGSRNAIHHNQVVDNRAAGISVGRRTGFPLGTLPVHGPTGNPRGVLNDLVRNTGSGNGMFDFWDGNPGCDQNTWRRNTGTGNQDCVTRR
ncbi:MAG TPA: right-handed parallel beta-helix repeat-containing protein [Egibacteraceae bacterium]|jgi:hypothetical protein|nr:right-handed parallel beta-helix repeat-containing protein [Egibacteraceae bacterium]